MSRRRRSPRGLLVLFLLGLVGLIWGTRPPEPMQRVRLLDGSVLTLDAITYGRRHRFVPGNAIQRIMAPLLPLKWRHAAGLGVFDHEREKPRHALWFTHRGKPGARAETVRMTFLDAHGCEFSAEDNRGSYMSIPAPPPSVPEVYRLDLVNYPRRDPKLRIRIYDRGSRFKPAGEFVIDTPGRSDTAPLTPGPTEQTAGDGLRCSLLSFVTGVDDKRPDRPARPLADGETRLGLRITDQTDGGWQPLEFTGADASGNQVENGQLLHSSGAIHQLRLWKNLCAEEPWKLHIALGRTRHFRPEDFWEVKGLPLPASGSTAIPAELRSDGSLVSTSMPATRSAFNAEGERHGLKLQLGGASWDAFDGYSVGVTAWGLLRGYRLSLEQATTDQGQKIPIKVGATSPVRFPVSWLGSRREEWERRVGRAPGEGDGLARWTFQLDPPKGVRKVNLRFAVHPTRTVEFTARPTRPSVKP